MTCRYCGNEMSDGSKFCPFCGAANKEFDANIGPEAPEKKSKAPLLIGIAAAVLAAAVLVIFLAGGLFSSPKGKVEKAAAKTAAAYAQAEKAMGLPDLSYMSKERSYSQRLALTLNSVNSAVVGYDLDALSGLGLGMDINLDGEGRQLDLALSLFWDEEELLRLLAAADDAEFYFHSPQLTGQALYGVNTETFGADLAAMSGDDSVRDLSFNLFDLIDDALAEMDPEALEQELQQANRDLWEAAQVEKPEAKTLDINGASTKTKAYRVTLPQEALERYVDSLETILSSMNYFALYEEMLQKTGLPQEEIDSFMEQLEEMDVYGELADGLKDLIARTGDLELEVCLSGGYVSALLYEGEISGSDVGLGLYLGGGQEYVDDMSLELTVDGVKTTMESSGDHGGKSGQFTDKTTIKSDAFGVFIPSIASEFLYEPKKAADNLSWELSIPGVGSLDLAGTLTAGSDSISLALDNMALKAAGMEICSLGLEYEAGPFAGTAAPDGDVQIITQMSEDELEQMVLDTQENALAWSDEMQDLFVSRLPPELIYGMLY